MTDELEIDLRPYIKALLKRWYLIVFVPLVVAVATYVFLKFQSPYYEATAMVAITEADVLVNFGSSIETLDEGRPAYQALPSFATGAELILDVFNALDTKPEGIKNVQDLSKKMEADSGDDLRLIFLTVKMPTPEEAERVANIWADLFIKKAHSVYGETDTTEVNFYQEQMVANLVNLKEAERVATEFEARNELSILRDQLTITQENYQRYLRQHESYDIIVQDLQGLRINLTMRNRGDPASFTDQLSLLSLQNAAYNAGESLPLFLQLPEDSILKQETVGAQINTVDDLISVLEEKKRTALTKVEELLPEITQLQEDISTLEMERTHIYRELDLKRFLDTTLARKLEEVRLSSLQTPKAFRLAGRAVAPVDPAGPRKLVPTAAAGVITGMVIVAILVFQKYWTSSGMAEDLKAD